MATGSNRQCTILRIKRKRNEEPLDALVFDPQARKKKSRGGLDVFQFAQTVEADAFENEQSRRDLEEKISELAKEDALKAASKPPTATPIPRPASPVKPKDEQNRRFQIVREASSDESRKQKESGAAPRVLSAKEIPVPPPPSVKVYDAVPAPPKPTPPEPVLDPEIEKFLPLLNEYLTLHDIVPTPTPTANTLVKADVRKSDAETAQASKVATTSKSNSATTSKSDSRKAATTSKSDSRKAPTTSESDSRRATTTSKSDSRKGVTTTQDTTKAEARKVAADKPGTCKAASDKADKPPASKGNTIELNPVEVDAKQSVTGKSDASKAGATQVEAGKADIIKPGGSKAEMGNVATTKAGTTKASATPTSSAEVSTKVDTKGGSAKVGTGNVTITKVDSSEVKPNEADASKIKLDEAEASKANVSKSEASKIEPSKANADKGDSRKADTKKETQSKTSSSIPQSSSAQDYVWDVFYRRPATLSEWNEAARSKVATLTGLSSEDFELCESGSESEEVDEADEDSNAEEYYQNDYPEEESEESDNSDEFHEDSEHEEMYRDPTADFPWKAYYR